MRFRFSTLHIAKHILIHELHSREVPVQCETLHPTQSPEELNAAQESQGLCSHMNASTCTKARALEFLSQIWEFCSHSCRTHKVLQIQRFPLQLLSQQQLFKIQIYTSLCAPQEHYKQTFGDEWSHCDHKKSWKASLISLRHWTASASPFPRSSPDYDRGSLQPLLRHFQTHIVNQ